MALISIIIPVYNMEKYLKKCLESVINQTLKEIEIILIDDGSTDNSGKICEEYASKDNRIKVIHQENKGVANARNNGIKIAKGKYLGFIDSDDWVSIDFYEKLYNKAIETNADIVKGNVKIIKDNEIESFLNGKIIDTKSKWIFYYEWWSAIYEKTMIKKNKIKFSEKLIYGEDSLFLHYSLKNSKKLEIVNNTYYYYQRHENNTDSDILSYEKICSGIEFLRDILFDFNSLYREQGIEKNEYSEMYFIFVDTCIRYFFRSDTEQSRKKCLESLTEFYDMCLEKDKLNKKIPLLKKINNKKNINKFYNKMISFKDFDGFYLENKIKILKTNKNIFDKNYWNELKNFIIYKIYLILLKLGIKEDVKKILKKIGFNFYE